MWAPGVDWVWVQSWGFQRREVFRGRGGWRRRLCAGGFGLLLAFCGPWREGAGGAWAASVVCRMSCLLAEEAGGGGGGVSLWLFTLNAPGRGRAVGRRVAVQLAAMALPRDTTSVWGLCFNVRETAHRELSREDGL